MNCWWIDRLPWPPFQQSGSSEPLVLLPFLENKKNAPRCLTVWLTTPELAIDSSGRARCRGCIARATRCTMHLALKGIEPDQVVGGVLPFRSRRRKRSPCRLTHGSSAAAAAVQCVWICKLDAHLPLKGRLSWDAYVQIRQFGAVYPGEDCVQAFTAVGQLYLPTARRWSTIPIFCSPTTERAASCATVIAPCASTTRRRCACGNYCLYTVYVVPSSSSGKRTGGV